MASLNTREELLRLSRRLLQSRGVSGFSFQDLADALKIRKASIHYHFKTKTDLLTSLLDEYRRDFFTWKDKVQDLAPDEKLRRYTRLFRHYNESDFQICPGGAFSLEGANLPASFRKKLCEFQICHHQWLEGVIKEGQKAAIFQRGLDPRSAALLIGTTIQGALQVSRMHESPAIFDRAMDAMLATVHKKRLT